MLQEKVDNIVTIVVTVAFQCRVFTLKLPSKNNRLSSTGVQQCCCCCATRVLLGILVSIKAFN